MQLWAHAEVGAGIGTNPIFAPWELHPVLIHFPIAFLLAGVLWSAYASWRDRLDLQWIATALLITGVITGLLAGAAGLLAWLTLPDSHTEQAHVLMFWHLGLMLGSVLLFLLVTAIRWRWPERHPGTLSNLFLWLAAVIFVVGSAVGGHMVYHGGAGIESYLMRPGSHGEHQLESGSSAHHAHSVDQ